MQRRDFLKTGLSFGTATFLSGCNQPQEHRAATREGEKADWVLSEFEHSEATIVELQRAQTEGRLTAHALAEAYFARMDDVDTVGPHLASVIERNPDAVGIAEALDRERKERGARGPLHGIPVLIKDYTAFLDAGALKGARLGVARNLFSRNEHVERVMEEAISTRKKLGVELVDPVEIRKDSDLEEAEMEALLYEFKAGLNQYFATLGPAASCKTLADLIAFNDANHELEMPYFAQELFLMALEKGPLRTKDCADAVNACRRPSSAEGIDTAMNQSELDALIAPTADPAFLIDLINGDHCTGAGCSSLPAVAGYPHVTVPAGSVFGLPVGISFFGRAWSESKLIAFTCAFEQARKRRFAPGFLKTADLSA
jgi:amidase